MYIYVRQGGGSRRPAGDVQTDVHIVPVDSNAQSRNLLKMPTASGEMVLAERLELPTARLQIGCSTN